MAVHLLCGSNIPSAVREIVVREVETLNSDASVLRLFDDVHAVCGPREGCHLGVALNGRVYRTGSIYTELEGGVMSCEGNHCSMRQRARDHYIRMGFECPRYATSNGGVGGRIDEGVHAGCFHRDCRGTFATLSGTLSGVGGVRVQTSTGYSAYLPLGCEKPFVLRDVNFVRFVEAEVGDSMRARAFASAEPVWWDHAVLGSSVGHTFIRGGRMCEEPLEQ